MAEHMVTCHVRMSSHLVCTTIIVATMRDPTIINYACTLDFRETAGHFEYS